MEYINAVFIIFKRILKVKLLKNTEWKVDQIKFFFRVLIRLNIPFNIYISIYILVLFWFLIKIIYGLNVFKKGVKLNSW